jgi:hypothetical protein
VSLGVILAAGVIASTALTSTGLYRTDAQAEHYVSTGLKAWAGINLAGRDDKTAFCINGYYSKHERRTHRHFSPVERQNRYGETTFRSFACTLSLFSLDRAFHLYLVTRPEGRWSVSVDR